MMKENTSPGKNAVSDNFPSHSKEAADDVEKAMLEL